MQKNIVIRIISRATLWSAAIALAACLAATPKAAAQDDQRITPSQNDSQTMQRPDNPAVNNQENQREMDRQNGQMDRQDDQTDRDRAAQGDEHGMDRGEVAQFDQFLDGHPEIAQDLRRNPDLVNDHRYVASHEELRDFLKDHPQVRRELKENPQALLSGDHHNDRRDNERRDDERNRPDEQRPPQF